MHSPKTRPYQMINTTPCDITIYDWLNPQNPAVVYLARPLQIRVEAQYEREGWVGGKEGVALLRETQVNFIVEDPQNLLAFADGLIVSREVASEILRAQSDEWRNYDIFIQGDIAHDDEGNVIGAHGLIQVKRKGE